MNEPPPETGCTPSSHGKTASRAAAIVVGLAVLAAGVVYGGAFRRSCGDTWIGLAAGRLISERGYRHFPVADEFTWTFAGHTWYNQNWLYHVLMYQIHERIFPTALVGLKLVSLLLMAGMLVVCAWRMCGEVLLAAVLAAGALAAGMPLWEIRPSMGTNVLACLLLLTLVWTTHGRAIWGLLVLPILLVWGNTHGGFLLGYVMIAAWVAGEVAEKFRRPTWRTMSTSAILATIGAMLVSIPLGAWLSPFGWMNFVHPFVVMRSPTFQRIVEWRSPFRIGLPADLGHQARLIQYPFFITLGVCAASLVFAVLLHDWAWRRLSLARQRVNDADLSGTGRGMTLSEIAIVLLVAYMGFSHIRFTVTLYTLIVPILCKFLAIRFREASAAWNCGRSGRRLDRRHARAAASAAGLSFALVLILPARDRIADAYSDPAGRPWRQGIFLHYVVDEREPGYFTSFARANGLTGRLFAEWSWGGYIMFHWPQARLFADGRSQALFDEKTYKLYHAIAGIAPPRGLPPAVRGEQIDQALEHPDVPSRLGAEMVLWMRAGDAWQDRIAPLLATGKWVPLLWNEQAILMVRRDAMSPGLPEAVARFERLDLKWPDDVWGLASRALAAQYLRTPDYGTAIEYYGRAIEKTPHPDFYAAMLPCLLNARGIEEARRYFTGQLDRLRRDTVTCNPDERAASLRTLSAILGRLPPAGSSPAGPAAR
ncbi:MAG: tetratricopeptide repeat protein [Phycisphaerae bacterium]